MNERFFIWSERVGGYLQSDGTFKRGMATEDARAFDTADQARTQAATYAGRPGRFLVFALKR